MHRSNPWMAGSLVGARVRNSTDENLGKIEELVVDPATGNISVAILSWAACSV